MELCIIGQEKSETNIKLLEYAKKQFDTVFFVPLSGIHIGLVKDFSIFYRTTNIFKFKNILARIPKPYYCFAYQILSLFPEDTFMPIKPISFLLSNERFFLLTILRKRGIDTINLRQANSTESALRLIEEDSFPLIIRTPEKKTGVIVKNKIEAKSIIGALVTLKQPILVEDIIKDFISVYVAEPDVLGVVKKKTKEKDIIFAPGEFKKHKIDIEVKELAKEATRAIESQIARVDISLGDKPKVVNIDLNPELISASKVLDVNLPEKIIKSVYNNYKNHQQRPLLVKFFEDAKSVAKDIFKAKQLLI